MKAEERGERGSVPVNAGERGYYAKRPTLVAYTQGKGRPQ